MRRILKILFLLGLLLPAAGCVHENYDKCPLETAPYSISLKFLLRDGGGDGNVFKSNISTVELGIYNDKGALVMTKHISQTELAEFEGVKLALDPGLYHVVGWGNTGNNTHYEGVDAPHPYGPHITYNNISSNRVTDTDKVYYAPKCVSLIGTADFSGAYRMMVDPVTGHAGVLEFTAAHRTIKVYIEGYNGMPVVELLNVPEGLEWFGMKWLSDAYDSKPALTASKATIPAERENVWYDYATFDVFHFDADNDIILNIIDNTTHEAACTVTLNEMFEEIGFPDGITISVVVKFTPAGVEVGIPKWESHEVDPDLGV